MIAWRTPIVRQAETTADNGEKDHGTSSSQPESAAPIREPPAVSPAPARSFCGHVKQLFRQIGQVLTLKPPQIQARRERKKRRQEETGKGFRRLALDVMRRVVPSIFDDPDFWRPPDHDEHGEYLRLLEISEQEDFNPPHDNGAFHYAEAEHLSLHL